MKLALVGESYALRSPAAAAQQTLNVYPQFVEDPNGTTKNGGQLWLCPGRRLILNVPGGAIRGTWSGGGRVFVVVGRHLCEIGQGSYAGGSGTGTVISTFDLGSNDGNPAQMFGNGNQLLVVANGFAYIDNGGGPVQALFTISGVVNTVGTAVTWVSGDDFSTIANGATFIIDGTSYTVSTVNSPTSITLTGSAGTQTGAFYSSPSGLPVTAVTGAYLDGFFIVQRPSGAPIQAVVNTSGTTVTYVSGMEFTGISVGDGVAINGVGYIVANIVGPTQITLVTSAGTQTSVTLTAGVDLGRQFNISAFEDGTSWDPLDFATKEAAADYLQAVYADREQLYLFGTETSEVWQNTGDPTFPLQRIPGAAQKQGLSARWGIVSMGDPQTEKVYFIGGPPRGRPVAYRLDGFTPVRVSTNAVEAAWNNSGAPPNAIVSWTYEEDGHEFWVIIGFDNLGAAWVYDATASAQAGSPMWHQRLDWNGSAFAAYPLLFHTYVQEWWGDLGIHVCGDSNGNLYEMSLAFFDDNGLTKQWQRILPALYAAGKWQDFGRMVLEMDTGSTTSGVTQPTVKRNYSDDRGNTFGNPVDPLTGGSGVSGKTAQRVFWPSNGGSYNPRVFMLSGNNNGNSRVCLIDLELEVEAA